MLLLKMRFPLMLFNLLYTCGKQRHIKTNHQKYQKQNKNHEKKATTKIHYQTSTTDLLRIKKSTINY